jgi:hypothetical protein
MTNILKLLITSGLFIALPFALGPILLNPKTSRRVFALILSIWMGSVFFVLSVMYVINVPEKFVVGAILFVLSLISGFPTGYFLYPFRGKTFGSFYQRKSNQGIATPPKNGGSQGHE